MGKHCHTDPDSNYRYYADENQDTRSPNSGADEKGEPLPIWKAALGVIAMILVCSGLLGGLYVGCRWAINSYTQRHQMELEIVDGLKGTMHDITLGSRETEPGILRQKCKESYSSAPENDPIVAAYPASGTTYHGRQKGYICEFMRRERRFVFFAE